MRFCSEVVLGMMVFGSMTMTGLRAESTPPPSLDATVALPSAVSVVRVDVRTGRLVRSVVMRAPAGAPSPSSMNPQVRAMVEETAKNLDVSPLLVDSVIQVESNYNPYAISPKGAQGLMQLMPATGRRFEQLRPSAEYRRRRPLPQVPPGNLPGRPARGCGLQRRRKSRDKIWERAALSRNRRLRCQSWPEVQSG
jgi:Transglycosylase SLT domain